MQSCRRVGVDSVLRADPRALPAHTASVALRHLGSQATAASGLRQARSRTRSVTDHVVARTTVNRWHSWLAGTHAGPVLVTSPTGAAFRQPPLGAAMRNGSARCAPAGARPEPPASPLPVVIHRIHATRSRPQLAGPPAAVHEVVGRSRASPRRQPRSPAGGVVPTTPISAAL